MQDPHISLWVTGTRFNTAVWFQYVIHTYGLQIFPRSLELKLESGESIVFLTQHTLHKKWFYQVLSREISWDKKTYCPRLFMSAFVVFNCFPVLVLQNTDVRGFFFDAPMKDASSKRRNSPLKKFLKSVLQTIFQTTTTVTAQFLPVWCSFLICLQVLLFIFLLILEAMRRYLAQRWVSS